MDPSSRESEPSDRSGWMIRPPGEGEVSIQVALGEGLEMTPEMRSKLDEFVMSVFQRGSESFIAPQSDCGSTFDNCQSFACDVLGTCRPLVRKPCAIYEGCTIG